MEVLSFHEPTCNKRMRPSDNVSQDGAPQNDITTEVDEDGNFNVRIPVPSRGTSVPVSEEESRASSHDFLEWRVPSGESSFAATGSGTFQQGNSGSCGDHFSMGGGSFLAKRHPNLTYLDLESRCIAL